MKQLIRYIKSILHYIKIRRLLERGDSINEDFKVPLSTVIDEELHLIDKIVLNNSKKYNTALDYVVQVDWLDDDFAKDLKTVSVEMWKL